MLVGSQMFLLNSKCQVMELVMGRIGFLAVLQEFPFHFPCFLSE